MEVIFKTFCFRWLTCIIYKCNTVCC